MIEPRMSLEERLAARGINRRSFLRFCTLMGATLALPKVMHPKIAYALSTAAVRPPVVWLEMQSCTGDTESFLRANNPNVASILLETISVNYSETVMVPSGKMALKSLDDTVAQYPGQYLCIVEGSIPTANNGNYCVIGGRTALSIAQTVCGKAAATIAVGSCSSSGGLPSATPNPTGAVGVQTATGVQNFVSLPGCPMNVTNLAALIVHYLTFGSLPPLDSKNRPLFAYGHLIHDYCERRGHYDNGRFVLQWGDAGHRQGYCLHHMGCRGPDTMNNCPTTRWNDGTSWPVASGHPCIGCSVGNFWDVESPFYKKLPG